MLKHLFLKVKMGLGLITGFNFTNWFCISFNLSTYACKELCDDKLEINPRLFWLDGKTNYAPSFSKLFKAKKSEQNIWWKRKMWCCKCPVGGRKYLTLKCTFNKTQVSIGKARVTHLAFTTLVLRSQPPTCIHNLMDTWNNIIVN